jgi:hypothetical protein
LVRNQPGDPKRVEGRPQRARPNDWWECIDRWITENRPADATPPVAEPQT